MPERSSLLTEASLKKECKTERVHINDKYSDLLVSATQTPPKIVKGSLRRKVSRRKVSRHKGELSEEYTENSFSSLKLVTERNFFPLKSCACVYIEDRLPKL